VGNYEYGGSLFDTKRAAVRALAESILVGEQSSVTGERVREVLEAHDGSLIKVLEEWIRATGERPAITVDRERFEPSEAALLSELARVAGEAMEGKVAPQRVLIGSIHVGINFGTSGAIWSALNGKLIETTEDVFPRGDHASALKAAEALAEKRGFAVIARSCAK
jgi:hypothetical protein